MKDIRVRYAPSPTGHLHIGGARTALFNYLYAKHHKGTFIFRLEDTDVARNIEGGERSQLDNLEWLGIIPDESPLNPNPKYGKYRQMERLDIYNQYVNELLEKGYAYKCFCTPEELDQEHEKQVEQGIAPRYSGKCCHLDKQEIALKEAANLPYTIRLKVPANKTYTFNDLIRGEVSFESNDIGDWVIVKANGIPTYNFAVVIDDHQMEISHVFRGEEHISNTPKQLMLYDLFGWEAPQYAHMTLIVNEAGKKLSKRDETIMQFISQYKEEGYLPEAMFNFLSLLGWSPKGNQEIFDHDNLIKIFDSNRLSKSPSTFDRSKLLWFNNKYIKKLDKEAYKNLVLPFLQDAYDLSNKSEEWVDKLISIYQDQLNYGKEIVELVDMFFSHEYSLNDEAKAIMKEEGVENTLKVFKAQLELMPEFKSEYIQAAIKETQVQTGAKGKMLYMPIRIATTGIMHGPDLSSSLELLGKELVLSRL